MPKIVTDWSGYQYSFLKVLGPGQTRRGARTVAFWGQIMPVKRLSELSGIKYTTLLYRLDHGCPPEKLIDEPDTTRRFTT